jgi:hypothetical protein
MLWPRDAGRRWRERALLDPSTPAQHLLAQELMAE